MRRRSNIDVSFILTIFFLVNGTTSPVRADDVVASFQTPTSFIERELKLELCQDSGIQWLRVIAERKGAACDSSYSVQVTGLPKDAKFEPDQYYPRIDLSVFSSSWGFVNENSNAQCRINLTPFKNLILDPTRQVPTIFVNQMRVDQIKMFPNCDSF